MKEGSRIKHEWLKKKNIREILGNQIIRPIESVEEMGVILRLSRDIEEKRNNLAYSSPVEEDEILHNIIDDFLDVKKIIEKKTGEINV